MSVIRLRRTRRLVLPVLLGTVLSFQSAGPSARGASGATQASTGVLTTGPDQGGGPHVRQFTLDGTPAEGPLSSFFAFDPSFSGGVRVAQGDVNDDGVPDLIVGAGPGGAPEVRIYDGATGILRASFLAFAADFRGGVFVAAGDVNGDGFADVVVGAGEGGTPGVRVFDGGTLAVLRDFLAFASNYNRGVRVAAGDVNGDGFADLIAGMGPPITFSASRFRVFDSRTMAVLIDAEAFGAGIGQNGRSGLYVAAGDVTGDGLADIVVGAGTGHQVKVIDGRTGQNAGEFVATSGVSGDDGAVHVAAGDVTGDGKADVIAAPGFGGIPEVSVFDGAAMRPLGGPSTPIVRFLAYDSAFRSGVWVATTSPLTRMRVDVPTDGASVPTRFRLKGWTFEDNVAGVGVAAVEVSALPVGGGAAVSLGPAVRGDSRPDVAAQYGPQYANAGFHLDIAGLAPGAYDLMVVARGPLAGTVKTSRTVRITVRADRPPLLTIDEPIAGWVPAEGFDIRGWALSLDHPSPPGVDAVHVWAFPVDGGAPRFVGAATMGMARPDVGLVFGSAYASSGFLLRAMLPPGRWDLAAYPHETGGSFFAPRVVRVQSHLSGGGRAIVTGADAGGSPHVRRFPALAGPGTGATVDIFAGDASFSGGVRVAEGDVNGDGVADIIAGWGPGAEPRVFVYDGRTGAQLAAFNAFEPSFRGGVFVAAGDVDGDGYAEVVVASGAGHPPEVNLFRGPDFRQIRHYSVFDFNFRGGISVAVGDVSGDGAAEVLIGTGPGVPAQVLIFDGVNGAESPRVSPYGAFMGGIYVAAADVNGDGFADIITGAGAGGGPHVRVFDGRTRAPGLQFFAFDPAFRGGVRVAAGDVNGDGRADIMAAAGPGGAPEVAVFDAATGNELARSLAYGPGFSGGVFVASAAPQNRMAIEAPLPGAVSNAFRISGWAFNENLNGTDIDLIDIWAIGVFGGGPIYLGQAVLAEARPDVASRFGAQYINSGFHLDVSGVSPALYDITVSGRSRTSNTFRVMRVVRVTVNP